MRGSGSKSAAVTTARDARHGARGLGVDRDERRVRRWRPDDAHPQLARAVDVVDEAPGAREEPGVLDAADRAADVGHASAAAFRTASRID